MTDSDNEKQLDPVAEFILGYVQSTDRPATPEAVAKAFYEPKKRENDRGDAWKKYFNAVKQQAFYLHRQGMITIHRRGEPVVEVKELRGKWTISKTQ